MAGGFESTKGTGVAATRTLMARITDVDFEIPREFVEEDRGTLVAAQRFNEGIKDYKFKIEQDGTTYEDLPWFFHTAVHGTPTSATINTAATRWTFTPQTTAGGDTLKAATIEFGDNTQEFECEYCEVNDFTLEFDTLKVGDATPVKTTYNYLTQSLSSNTKTTLTLPTVETILANRANWFDGSTSTAYASLAEVTGTLRSFSLKYDNNLARKAYVGDPEQTYSNIGRGRRVVTFEATVEGNATGVGYFPHWSIGTQRRWRIRFQGDTITGSSPSTTKKLTIDFRYVLTGFEPVGAVDTNTVFKIMGRCMPDTALSDAEIAFEVVNDVSAYT